MAMELPQVEFAVHVPWKFPPDFSLPHMIYIGSALALVAWLPWKQTTPFKNDLFLNSLCPPPLQR